jgi:hypothetical protein
MPQTMNEALAAGMVLWAGGTPNGGDLSSIGMKYGPNPDRADVEACLEEGDVLVCVVKDDSFVTAQMTDGKLVPLPGALPSPEPAVPSKYKPAMTPKELEREMTSKTSAEEYEGVDWRLTRPEFRHEPIFQLLARDRFAAVVAELWISIAVQHLGYDHPKIVSARKRVQEIKRWQEIHGTKHPD